MVGPVVLFVHRACWSSLLPLALLAAPALAEQPSVVTVRPAEQPTEGVVETLEPAPPPTIRAKVAKPAKPAKPEKPPELGPEDLRPIRIALTSGNGFNLVRGETGVNPFGVAFGLRGGYSIGPVYVGTRFLFFLGEARSLPDGGEQSADEWLLGFEGGYGWRAGPLVFRPELGLGIAFSSSESAITDATAPPMPVDTSSEDPYLELGVVLELDLSRELFIGVDGRVALVAGKKSVRSDGELVALLAMGTIGMRF